MATTLAFSPLSRWSKRWPDASEWLTEMGRGLSRARTLGLAAEVSFWLFLALVPLTAIAGLVTARLIATHGTGVLDVFAAVPPEARQTIAEQVAKVAARGGHVAPLAVGTFLWLGASGLQSIFDVLEVQAGGSRPWWRKRLVALGACVALSAGVAVLALLGAGLERVEALLGATAPSLTHGVAPSVASAVARTVAALCIGFGMIAGLYRIGVPRRARGKAAVAFPIFPGAALATGLAAALGAGYGLYVSMMGTGDAYLGGLAAVGVTLMVLWLFSVAILLGAELNRLVYVRRSGRSGESLSP